MTYEQGQLLLSGLDQVKDMITALQLGALVLIGLVAVGMVIRR